MGEVWRGNFGFSKTFQKFKKWKKWKKWEFSKFLKIWKNWKLFLDRLKFFLKNNPLKCKPGRRLYPGLGSKRKLLLLGSKQRTPTGSNDRRRLRLFGLRTLPKNSRNFLTIWRPIRPCRTQFCLPNC